MGHYAGGGLDGGLHAGRGLSFILFKPIPIVDILCIIIEQQENLIHRR